MSQRQPFTPSLYPTLPASITWTVRLNKPEHSPVRMSFCLLCLGLLQISLGAFRQVTNTEAAFTIDQVTLTLLPGTMVERGTNVTMRCEARVSQSQPQPLMYSFNFTQDDQVVYSKNISDLVVERSISPARVSNSGRYICTVSVNTKYKKSGSQTLKVTGLQTPVMKVKSDIISEGEEITATCSAPEETGSFIFSFYENGQEIKQTLSVKNYVETLLTVNKLSDTYLNCKYQLMQHPNAGSSNKSNTVKIVVRDLEEITPAIFIKPKQNVVEGDRVQFECRVPYSYDLELFLTKESTILKKLHTTFTHNFMVRAEDSGDYVCKAEKGSVQKTATDHLSVAELFSRPVLRMIPEQVFEGQQFHLVCSSAINSTQRIRKEDLKYVLLKEDRHISTQASYINTASLTMNGKYSCVAEAKGINKTSLPLLFKAKVPVSTPVIRNVGKVIVGRPFRVVCEAENGTLPITYTLLKSLSPVAQMTVSSPADKAIFDIPSIRYLEDISTFSCQAHNQGSHMSSSSASLQAAVIVPVSKPVLTVESKGFTVTEGSDLTLICSVQQGTDPITFTWYHNGVVIPSSTQKVTRSQGTHVVVAVEREQRGNYYCDATNDATETKRSPPVTIGVSLAVWKKALIGVFCLLLLVAIIIVLIVFFKKMSNPRKKKQATELSVKPSRPKSGDPMRISLTLDIEDNTALNGTPCVMGRNVWSENVSGSESDDPAEEDSKLVYPQEVDPSRDDVPVKKATEPEHNVQCTEAQVSTPGVLEQAEGQAALEYAQLNNSEQEPQSLVST